MSEHLWIGNVPPEATDEEVVALAKKYSELEGKVVQRLEGDGSRPVRVLEFVGAPLGAVDTLALRLAGMYWKERQLHAYKIQHDPSKA
jgi:hypothetical protein